MTSSSGNDGPDELPSRRVFLSAEWRDLAMLNYEVDPALLARHIPHGMSLDSFEGKTYISLVGFRFCHTRLFGHFSIPFHANFDEVNLRFYVRRKHGSEIQRGVAFIAEAVPRRAISLIARLVYGENYKQASMRHSIEAFGDGKKVEFQWRVQGQWCRVWAQAEGRPLHPGAGSLEQFITEHYWGYSARRSAGTLEYRVSHVPWQVWAATTAGFEGDASALYGREFVAVLQRPANSAFIADGSSVTVFRGTGIL
jgi:uncharacterized protein YqjF (DUF2071 family)